MLDRRGARRAPGRSSTATIRSGATPRRRTRRGRKPIDDQRAVRLHREHVSRCRRQDADARGQRQHRRRGAGLELVHQPDRPRPAGRPSGSCAAPTPAAVRRRDRGRSSAARSEGDHARADDPRHRRGHLLRQVRSAEQSRNGERRRGHLDEVLLRLRLPHARELRRHAAPRGAGRSIPTTRSTDEDGTRRADATHATSTTLLEEGGAQRRRLAIASSRARRCPGVRSGTSATTAHVPTIRTTSSRTSTAASCAGCRSSPRG